MKKSDEREAQASRSFVLLQWTTDLTVTARASRHTMAGHEEAQRNQQAYQRLKDSINQTYRAGWFVGIADDQVVGDADNFRDLERSLRAQGKDPRSILIVQAGVETPDYVTIFA